MEALFCAFFNHSSIWSQLPSRNSSCMRISGYLVGTMSSIRDPSSHQYLVFNNSSSLSITSRASTTSSLELPHSSCAKLVAEINEEFASPNFHIYLSIRLPVAATSAGLPSPDLATILKWRRAVSQRSALSDFCDLAVFHNNI